MADDKKDVVPEVEMPAGAPATEQPGPEPVLTSEEAAILEQEGRAALLKMGEFVPDKPEPIVGDPTLVEQAEPTVPEPSGVTESKTPTSDKEAKQTAIPSKDDPPPAPSGKVVDFAAAREGAAKDKAPDKQRTMPRRGRPAKESKGNKPEKGKAKAPRDKISQSKRAASKAPTAPAEAPTAAEAAPEQPPAPKDAARSTEPEQIVYIDLSELHAFKNHPFGVRDDTEMQGLVESVKASGVNQPALVRPREEGGYEIVAGHRRQRASELAGYANMPCIVRNMTDDEAILAMTDDNLRHREKILPTEKANSLKMQVEAIKHQGGPGLGEDAGKRSTEIVGARNGMNYKQVQRYIRLTELVPELQKMVDGKGLAFTPAVEISFIRPKHQRYIAVSIEGQQSTPSLSQAQQLRKLDKEGKLNPDIIDGILSQEKKKEDRNVIINGAELEKYFGKDKSPREMKDQIIALLDDWKAKQPPELGKPEKKADLEK